MGGEDGTGTTALTWLLETMMIGASAMALAVVRPPIPQARAQFLDVVVFAPASARRPLEEANALFLYENGSGVKMTYGNSSALAKPVDYCG